MNGGLNSDYIIIPGEGIGEIRVNYVRPTPTSIPEDVLIFTDEDSTVEYIHTEKGKY
jgi:hypothetical protein